MDGTSWSHGSRARRGPRPDLEPRRWDARNSAGWTLEGSPVPARAYAHRLHRRAGCALVLVAWDLRRRGSPGRRASAAQRFQPRSVAEAAALGPHRAAWTQAAPARQATGA